MAKDHTTFTSEEFVDGKILEMNEANRIYSEMASAIKADTTIADQLMGRGSENRALLRTIRNRLNEMIPEEVYG